MKANRVLAIVFAMAAISCGYPYIFGTSVNTKGIANGKRNNGIVGAQTTVHGLDDVSQSVSYANGTEESNARTKGEAIFTPKLHGANANADAINTGEGNALADAVSKSFNPNKKYYNKHYRDYIQFLNSLFRKYPQKREQIIKIVLKYAKMGKKGSKKQMEDEIEMNLNMEDQKMRKHYKRGRGHRKPNSIGNFNNDNFKAIGQTTFDYQRARGSGRNTAASANSGNFRWNRATVHQGDAVGNAQNGWATSSSNNYGLGRVNYVNSEQNSGAYGNDAQTNSSSNYYLAKDSVWNNGNAWGKADGDKSLAFSNINGNSYGYGAVNGKTNAYTDGDTTVSKSKIKGAPYHRK